MVVVSDDSSSSDEEALKRCQEAAWVTPSDPKKVAEEDIKVQPSKRLVVADHEHDCNELQVTQGFRTHVAKKLGHFLDSSITEMCTDTLSFVESATCDDEGFLLFSTSVPGQEADDSPAPVKRRPVPSSSDSDSDMETRLREAAVSVKDLLLESLPLATFSSTPSAELPSSEKNKGQESPVVKKKKKKKKKKQIKPNQEQGEQVDSAGSPQNAQINGEQDLAQVKGKRKRKRTKKQKELHTKEEALN
ncbi:putative protein C12orf43 [Liparis tanakae]|uniref:Protein CUSTOS n=1 Tax=Liparis tanakae TaxID=230148 RepID=A0A4Z2HZ94_9TELE|nr:putative protein C12orf43 [Liparis tanakae]